MSRGSGAIHGAWLAAMNQAIAESINGLSSDLHHLRERIAPMAWRSDRPALTSTVAGNNNRRYQRHLIARSATPQYQALLIAWPANHQTPLHDHDGLWGIELVLDGVLSVSEYHKIGSGETAELVPERSEMLGIGDAAIFSGPNYVHSCRNLSADHVAVSLHIYGGELERYSTFTPDGMTYRVAGRRTQIEASHVV